MKFVIDMMGGDNGIKATIGATKEFINRHKDVEVFLVGDLNALNEFKYEKNVHLVESKTVLRMDVDPLTALKEKDSSLMVAINTYLQNGCDALISAGSTGALLSAAIFKIKRIEGITRPCLITSFPTIKKNKKFVVCDLGANNSNTKEELVQFAIMGSIYYSILYQKKDPEIYLLSNGTEEEKGSPLGKEAYPLLEALSDNRSLTYLDISNNKIGSEGIYKLAQSLLRNSSIQYLNIDQNCDDFKAFQYIISVYQCFNMIMFL